VSLFGRQFARRVEQHTEHARERFPDSIHEDLAQWISAITEEVGKLARANNKLLIARDLGVRQQWTEEVRHRCLTIASLVRRLAEHASRVD